MPQVLEWHPGYAEARCECWFTAMSDNAAVLPGNQSGAGQKPASLKSLPYWVVGLKLEGIGDRDQIRGSQNNC